jgi:hypothetical protein
MIKMPIRRNISSFLLLLPVLLTPFIYSGELYNGIISAKQIWFYGAMALLLVGTGLQLLFWKQPLQIALNRVDVALLLFYSYLAIRAATTPYMPMLHNVRFINYSLCVALYFVVKIIVLNTEAQRNGEEYILNAKSRRLEEFVENNNLEPTPKSKESENVIANEEKQSIDKEQIASSTSLLRNDETTSRSELKFSGFVSSCSFLNIIAGILIATGLAQALWGLLQLYGFLPSFNSNFKITGTFYNPAPYALYLAAIFPMALGKVLSYKRIQTTEILSSSNFIRNLIFKFSNFIIFKFSYYLSLLTIIAILLVLPATMIRAAWLGAIAGSLLVLQYKYRLVQTIQQFLNTRIRRITALTVTLTLLLLLGTGLYHLKKDSANGKLFIWEVTLGKIAENPLFGHGVGRFEAEYNNWQAGYFKQHPDDIDGPKARVAGNTKYAFNEFLELSSETGLIGLVLFLVLIASVFPIYNHSTDNTLNSKWLNGFVVKWLFRVQKTQPTATEYCDFLLKVG